MGMTLSRNSQATEIKWQEGQSVAFSVARALSSMEPGESPSIDTLLPLVYAELRALAAAQLNQHRSADGRSHTLQPTALVHEAFIKMIGNDKGWSGRDHFMAVASIAMRQVLVDHARRTHAEKRGGKQNRANLTIDAGDVADGASRELQIVDLDDLLTQLAVKDERVARIAEMRLFGGMEQDQIANVLGVSRMTVHRDWLVARAWLAAKFSDDAASVREGASDGE
jgi:RNA polymerase sigma factor (TIGR02999 family)